MGQLNQRPLITRVAEFVSSYADGNQGFGHSVRADITPTEGGTVIQLSECMSVGGGRDFRDCYADSLLFAELEEFTRDQSDDEFIAAAEFQFPTGEWAEAIRLAQSEQEVA